MPFINLLRATGTGGLGGGMNKPIRFSKPYRFRDSRQGTDASTESSGVERQAAFKAELIPHFGWKDRLHLSGTDASLRFGMTGCIY